MLKRWLPLALCFSSVSAQSPAVEPSIFSGYPSDALIQQWIAADDPRLTAWGAHFILADRRESLLPLVEATIERWEAGRSKGPANPMRNRAMVVLLDTEIQLSGKVSAEVLAHLDSIFDTQRLVLLRNVAWEEAEPLWRSLYRPTTQDAYQDTRVAAQILAQRPPAGFAAQVLRSIDVKARITVHDAGSGLGFGYGCSGGCGAGIMREPANWPEAGLYRLVDPPSDGSAPPPSDQLWIAGPDPIYLRRQVDGNYSFPGCGGGLTALNDAITSHIVGTMLGGNPAAPFPERTLELDIDFRDRESYRAQVVALVEHQQENFNQVASALTALGLLTEEERQASTLVMELTLIDYRAKPNIDLPVIHFRPPVRWAGASH